MSVDLRSLKIGKEYERPYLADLWGYRGYQAISKGVVTPSGSNLIILFVTEEKQESLTQYSDHLDGSFLHWEGEIKHGTDDRVIGAYDAGDQIHLFHRKRHHSPFVYLGEIWLEQHNKLQKDPSQFIFCLDQPTQLRQPEAQYGGTKVVAPTETERTALTKSRIGQGVFRDGLIRLWGGCAVTGYKRRVMLLASHIKPWSASSNIERLDPYNGLLLSPTVDKLFDRGLITFDNRGRMLRSSILEADELEQIGVPKDAALTKVPSSTLPYLEYHRDHEFERNNEKLEYTRLT